MNNFLDKVEALKKNKDLMRKYRVEWYWGFYAWYIAFSGLLVLILLSLTLFKKTQVEWIVNAATLIAWTLMAWLILYIFKPKTNVLREKVFYLYAFRQIGFDAMPNDFKEHYPKVMKQWKIVFLEWNKIVEDFIFKKTLVIVLVAKFAMLLGFINMLGAIVIGFSSLFILGFSVLRQQKQGGYINNDVFVIYTLSQVLNKN